jgi:hypothetical protein
MGLQRASDYQARPLLDCSCPGFPRSSRSLRGGSTRVGYCSFEYDTRSSDDFSRHSTDAIHIAVAAPTPSPSSICGLLRAVCCACESAVPAPGMAPTLPVGIPRGAVGPVVGFGASARRRTPTMRRAAVEEIMLRRVNIAGLCDRCVGRGNPNRVVQRNLVQKCQPRGCGISGKCSLGGGKTWRSDLVDWRCAV